MKEIINGTILPALIGAATSLFTTYVAKKINEHGKLRIYCKMVGSSINEKVFGTYKMDNGKCMIVPLWIDMFNTANKNRFIRDLNIVAYKDGKEVCCFTQAQGTNIGKENEKTFGNKEMYSFIVEPNSAIRYKGEFFLKKDSVITNDKQFSSLNVRYYDEKDIKKEIEIYRFNVDDVWKFQEFEHDNEWIRIK